MGPALVLCIYTKICTAEKTFTVLYVLIQHMDFCLADCDTRTHILFFSRKTVTTH